jgi:NAD(P)-dependent dehydrogenase (short-subunit alcohol dehydrogenase family)
MSTDQPLANKMAIVTGSSRGIGKAIALGFVQAGAAVVITSRRRGAADTIAREICAAGGTAIATACNVSQASDVEAMVNATQEVFGRIDIMVCNAGISPAYKRAELQTEEEWDSIINANLKGVFLCCRAAGKVMISQKAGKIINISSIGGVVALPRLLAYCAAKGGVEQITRVLAAEWAPYNIQVNALAPGWVETDMTAGLRETPRLSEAILRQIPAGRFAAPNEMVGAAIFLASSASTYITGHTLLVDGGLTAI